MIVRLLLSKGFEETEEDIHAAPHFRIAERFGEADRTRWLLGESFARCGDARGSAGEHGLKRLRVDLRRCLAEDDPVAYRALPGGAVQTIEGDSGYCRSGGEQAIEEPQDASFMERNEQRVQFFTRLGGGVRRVSGWRGEGYRLRHHASTFVVGGR